MSNNYEEIIGVALSLPPGARAMLAERLLESLDAVNQSEIDALWAVEAENRAREIAEGRAATIPAKEILSSLRAREK